MQAEYEVKEAKLNVENMVSDKPIVPDYLSKKNAHPRDEHITFDEGPHIYTVYGEQGYTSVTTFVHHHFPAFDSDACVDKIVSSNKYRTDPTYKYYGKTREDILNEWKMNGEIASRAGTKMHYDIECYYNQIPVVNESIEYSFFQRFVQDYPELTPYRTEWIVFYEEYKLSGSIDMVFENEDGTLQIYDWKRCKSIEHEAFGGACGNLPCISHLPDSNFWHYSLQLNMYRRILQDKYGKKVTGLYLMCLHPDNYNKNYQRIEVPFLDEEVSELLSYWILEPTVPVKPPLSNEDTSLRSAPS
jgi:hypothetical protein